MRFEKDIIFTLSIDIFGSINSCIKMAHPNEACGFIFGTVQEINIEGDYKYEYYGEKFQCIKSSVLNPVSFLIDNDMELLELSNTLLEKNSKKLLAVLHSHPAGAIPSSLDKKTMNYFHNCGIKKFAHLIWIIVDSLNHNINGFVYLENKLFQIEIKVSDE